MIRATRRFLRRPNRPSGHARGDDSGVSLVELLVSMGLMSVFMALFTGAVLQIYGTVQRGEAIDVSQSQVTRAVARLDKEVRYASEVSTPGVSGGATYVEYYSTFNGTSQCSQLRLNPTKKQLKLRTWPLGGIRPAWTQVPVLVSDVSTLSFPALAGTSGYQRLKIRITATYGGAAATSEKTTLITFTALNSSSGATNTSVTSCVQRGDTGD